MNEDLYEPSRPSLPTMDWDMPEYIPMESFCVHGGTRVCNRTPKHLKPIPSNVTNTNLITPLLEVREDIALYERRWKEEYTSAKVTKGHANGGFAGKSAQEFSRKLEELYTRERALYNNL